MIGLVFNSLGNHNNPLCWSIIPHQSESELTYTGTFPELQEAGMLLFDIHTCDNPQHITLGQCVFAGIGLLLML